MGRKNIPAKFNKQDCQKKMPSICRFPINILQQKIKKGEIQQRPAAPAKDLAQPIPINSLLHYTNLYVKNSFDREELISGEKQRLKGAKVNVKVA